MKLHEDKILFREAIEAAAQHLKLRPVFIEKDYWVTYVLRSLGLSKCTDTVIFKGGTSLSKAYQCIDRFSEDIDLAILSPRNYTGNQLKNLLKEVTETISKGLQIERTFFEKILSLNRLSYEGKAALQEKIRHFYDLPHHRHPSRLFCRPQEHLWLPLTSNIHRTNINEKLFIYKPKVLLARAASHPIPIPWAPCRTFS